LLIHATTLLPGRSPHPAHVHADLEELVIVRDGLLGVTIGGVRTVLGPGSVAVAQPGEAHGFENAGDAPVTYYVFRYRARVPVNTARGRAAGANRKSTRQNSSHVKISYAVFCLNKKREIR